MKKLQHEPGRWPVAPSLDAKWEPRDGGRPPREPPNAGYPNGCDLDLAEGDGPACATALPYVPNRLGLYFVRCALCGRADALTVAGRVDDALAVRVSCDVRRDQ